MNHLIIQPRLHELDRRNLVLKIIAMESAEVLREHRKVLDSFIQPKLRRWARTRDPALLAQVRHMLHLDNRLAAKLHEIDEVTK